MRTVLLASVRVHARRYVAAVLAVVVGVGFIVATGGLASAARAGLLSDLRAEYTGVDVVVQGAYEDRQVDRVRSAVADLGGSAVVNAEWRGPVAVDGRVLSDQADAGTVALDPELRWQQLVAGAYPTRPGEALVDAHAAEQFGVHVGDRLRVGGGPDAVQVRVTGTTATSSGPLGSPLYLTYPDLRRAGEVVLVDTVAIACADCAGALREALPGRYVVQPATEYLQGLQAEATQGVDVISVVLLVFAAIAFFVSALVIANTFSILLAQRARDFALLRCVGATRRQVLRSVRTETLVVGTGSATLGVVAGVGLGYGLAAVAGLAWPGLPLGAVSFPLTWVGGGWLTGLLVTVGAGLLPARRATRVSPLAALRPATLHALSA
jgi:putative ABC transport system permease protein